MQEQLPRRRKVVPCLYFTTEECADIVDTMLSALTKRNTGRVRQSFRFPAHAPYLRPCRHSAVTVRLHGCRS
jgi:hypothetical protein